MKPRYFALQSDFRAWLEAHYDDSAELLVGFQKLHTGKKSLTYRQALDEALCFGWIDGVRRSVDENRYTIRFSPRKSKSYWSAVNVKRAEELIALGQMMPPGLKAFKGRDQKRTAEYSFERKTRELEPAQLKQFRKVATAWTFFEAQPPSYRRAVIWWVVGAKQEETRARRLGQLIELCKRGERHPQLISRKAPPRKHRPRH